METYSINVERSEEPQSRMEKMKQASECNGRREEHMEKMQREHMEKIQDELECLRKDDNKLAIIIKKAKKRSSKHEQNLKEERKQEIAYDNIKKMGSQARACLAASINGNIFENSEKKNQKDQRKHRRHREQKDKDPKRQKNELLQYTHPEGQKMEENLHIQKQREFQTHADLAKQHQEQQGLGHQHSEQTDKRQQQSEPPDKRHKNSEQADKRQDTELHLKLGNHSNQDDSVTPRNEEHKQQQKEQDKLQVKASKQEPKNEAGRVLQKQQEHGSETKVLNDHQQHEHQKQQHHHQQQLQLHHQELQQQQDQRNYDAETRGPPKIHITSEGRVVSKQRPEQLMDHQLHVAQRNQLLDRQQLADRQHLAEQEQLADRQQRVEQEQLAEQHQHVEHEQLIEQQQMCVQEQLVEQQIVRQQMAEQQQIAEQQQLAQQQQISDQQQLASRQHVVDSLQLREQRQFNEKQQFVEQKQAAEQQQYHKREQLQYSNEYPSEHSRPVPHKLDQLNPTPGHDFLKDQHHREYLTPFQHQTWMDQNAQSDRVQQGNLYQLQHTDQGLSNRQNGLLSAHLNLQEGLKNITGFEPKRHEDRQKQEQKTRVQQGQDGGNNVVGDIQQQGAQTPQQLFHGERKALVLKQLPQELKYEPEEESQIAPKTKKIDLSLQTTYRKQDTLVNRRDDQDYHAKQFQSLNQAVLKVKNLQAVNEDPLPEGEVQGNPMDTRTQQPLPETPRKVDKVPHTLALGDARGTNLKSQKSAEKVDPCHDRVERRASNVSLPTERRGSDVGLLIKSRGSKLVLPLESSGSEMSVPIKDNGSEVGQLVLDNGSKLHQETGNNQKMSTDYTNTKRIKQETTLNQEEYFYDQVRNYCFPEPYPGTSSSSLKQTGSVVSEEIKVNHLFAAETLLKQNQEMSSKKSTIIPGIVIEGRNFSYKDKTSVSADKVNKKKNNMIKLDDNIEQYLERFTVINKSEQLASVGASNHSPLNLLAGKNVINTDSVGGSNNSESTNMTTSGHYTDAMRHLSPNKPSANDPLSHRIIEKRRRDRMNNCLADLNRLIPPYYLKKGRGRVEKTEIIEMAIKYMKYLQQQQQQDSSRDMDSSSGLSSGSSPSLSGAQMDQWSAGYQEAMARTLQFLVEVEGLFSGDSLCVRLMNYLSKHCKKLLAREGYTSRKVPGSPFSSSSYHANGSSSNGFSSDGNGNYSSSNNNDGGSSSSSSCGNTSAAESLVSGPFNGSNGVYDNDVPMLATADDVANGYPRVGNNDINDRSSAANNTEETITNSTNSNNTSTTNIGAVSNNNLAVNNNSSHHHNQQQTNTNNNTNNTSNQDDDNTNTSSVKFSIHAKPSGKLSGKKNSNSSNMSSVSSCYSSNDGGYCTNSSRSGGSDSRSVASSSISEGSCHGKRGDEGGNREYGNGSGSRDYGNSSGNNNRDYGNSSGNNNGDYAGNNNSSRSCNTAIESDEVQNSSDHGMFGQSRQRLHVKSSSGRTNVGPDADLHNSQRPRSAQHSSSHSCGITSSGLDNRQDRTSSAPVLDNGIDASDLMNVARSALDSTMKNLLQHSSGSSAICKSSRDLFFSSDNGSNASSSGDDNPSRLYKFKSNMKHRFSVDLEHSQVAHPAKKQRRDSGSSSSNYDQYDSMGRPSSNNYSNESLDPLHSSNELSDRTSSPQVEKFGMLDQISRPISTTGTLPRAGHCKTPVDDATKTSVPIFAFNQSGSFYVPMSVDPSVVASAMSIKPEISPVLHPVSIYVNFTPACIGSSIAMSPLTTTTPIIRQAYSESVRSSKTVSSFPSVSCPPDSILEDVKPIIITESKEERFPSTKSDAPSTRLTHSTSSSSYTQDYNSSTSISSSNSSKVMQQKLEPKPDLLDYSEMTRPSSKGERSSSRLTVAKAVQDVSRDNSRDGVPTRSLHHVPELRHHDVIPQLCKMRDMRDLANYHSNHQVHLSHHQTTHASPLSAHHPSLPGMSSQASSSIHPHAASSLPSMSAFTATHPSIPLQHQLQHSNHGSPRMLRDMRNPRELHGDLPASASNVRDYFEPAAYTAGFHRAAIPWPYQIPGRPFKV